MKPLWGRNCPLLALAALACLSPEGGEGPVCSWLALLCCVSRPDGGLRLGIFVALVSLLFCEWAWRCLSESESEVAQSCLTLCKPMNSSLPGSTVHGIFQARILEWAAISFSRGSFQSRDRTWVSCIADRRFTI